MARVRELALSYPEIIGIHDLIVHDYGPGRRMISLHAEVPASENVLTLHGFQVYDRSTQMTAK